MSAAFGVAPCAVFLALAATAAPPRAGVDGVVRPALAPDAVVLKACKLMPLSLRDLLSRKESLLLEGFRAPLGVPEPGRPADEALLDDVDGAVSDLRGDFRQGDVARRLGRVARLLVRCKEEVFRSAEAPAAPWVEDFRSYSLKKTPRFVAAFSGFSPVLFADGDVAAFVEGVREAAREFSREVAAVYLSGGTSETFDDRSAAFGLASIEFGRSVSEVANLWLYIWRQAGGDTAGAPWFHYDPRPPRDGGAARGRFQKMEETC